MKILVKKPASQFVRWIKEFMKQNKSSYKWYECDHWGV